MGPDSSLSPTVSFLEAADRVHLLARLWFSVSSNGKAVQGRYGSLRSWLCDPNAPP